MPRRRQGEEPVSEDLAEVKEKLDELLHLVTEWEGQQGDDRKLSKLADETQHYLLIVPRDLLQVAMKFRTLEQLRRREACGGTANE